MGVFLFLVLLVGIGYFEKLSVDSLAKKCEFLIKGIEDYKLKTGAYPDTPSKVSNVGLANSCNYSGSETKYSFVLSGYLYALIQFYEYDSETATWQWD